MTDIRALLVEVLRDQWVPSTIVYGTDEPAGFHSSQDWAKHVADVLLSLPGIAIIELPEPDYTDEPEPGVKGYGFNGGPADAHIARERGVYAHDGLVYDQWDGVTAAQARAIASWWLAAARAAEQADTDA